jgi:hypothetical protein
VPKAQDLLNRLRCARFSPAEQGQKNTARSSGKKAVRKKAAPRKARPARPLRKEMGSKSKTNKLVCRYCGSDDLAPSSILSVENRAGALRAIICQKARSLGHRPSANSVMRRVAFRKTRRTFGSSAGVLVN